MSYVDEDQEVNSIEGGSVAFFTARGGPQEHRCVSCDVGLCDAHVHCTAVTADLSRLMSLPESYVTARCALPSFFCLAAKVLMRLSMSNNVKQRNQANRVIEDVSTLNCVFIGYVPPPRASGILEGMLSRGFTTVRDCGM